MAESDTTKILETTKAALGLQPDYDPFDVELLMHINSVLSILGQLGVGPTEGFVANADTTWAELLPDSKVEDAKTYVYLRVKMVFDSGSMTPSVVAAYEKTIEELGFRITVAVDPLIPQEPPSLEDLEDEELILDGGGP